MGHARAPPSVMHVGTRARTSFSKTINRAQPATMDGATSSWGSCARTCCFDRHFRRQIQGRIGGVNRSGKAAAIMIVLLAISLILLVIMPAESDDVVDQLVTYASVAIYIVALSLVGVVVYYRRSSPVERSSGARGSADSHEDFDDEISEIEREFEALEKETEREERG